MAWYDKISDTWNTIGEVAGLPPGAGDFVHQATQAAVPKIGAAWSAVTNSDDWNAFVSPFKITSNALAYPLNMAQRGVAATLLNDPQKYGASTLFNGDAWEKAWNLTDVHDVGNGQQVEGISTGQVFTGGGDDLFKLQNLKDTPEQAAARQNYFHDQWSGKITSGAIDLAFGLFADPLVFIGKAAKGVEAAHAGIDAEHVNDALALSAGGATADQVSKKAVKAANAIDQFLAWTSGKTAAQIATHPALRDNEAGGTIAHLMYQADQGAFDLGPTVSVGPGLDPLETKRDLLGALLGDEYSIAAIKNKHAMLANEVAALGAPPSTAPIGMRWNPATGGFELVYEANAANAPEVANQIAAINGEITRLDRIVKAKGTSSVIKGTIGAQYSAAGDMARLQSSTLYSGIGNRPVTIITGLLSNRLEGNIALRDPVAGSNQLLATLKQAPHLTDDIRRGLMDKFYAAPTDSVRGDVVRQAEAAILQSTADHYNIPANQIGTLMKLGEARRNAWTSVLKSRLYSAADSDAYIHYADPETGAVTVVSKPILQSQIEAFHPILDPRVVDSTLRAGSQNRLFERMMSYLGPDGADFASEWYKRLDSFGDVVGAGLHGATKMWKDGMLLLRAPAYGARIQIDSQLRLGAHMGVLNTMAGLQKSIPGLLTYYGNRKALGHEGALTEAFAKMYGDHPIFKDFGLGRDEIGKLVRTIAATGGSHADIADEMFNKTVEALRGSGDFGFVDGTDKLWTKGWNRAVVQQIRNSPTAMKIIYDHATGAFDPEAIKQWVLSNPDSRKEWAEIGPTISNDMDQWIAKLDAHVNHYLPTPELLGYALKDNVTTRKMVDDYFTENAGENRMRIHGESYNPLSTKGSWQQWYDGTRENLYQLVSDAPETLMARVPLYMHEFASNMTEIQARLEANLRRQLTPEELMDARISADRMARRSLGKTLFDASHTSNLSHGFKYVAPFFAAWEDMIKKWGSLLYRNPAYGERLRQVWNIPENTGLATDEYGNRIDAQGRHFDIHGNVITDPARIGSRDMLTVPLGMIPESWRNAIGLPGDTTGPDGKRIPGALRLDKKSFNIIFQGDPWWLPGFGPLVQIPANQIIKNSFPEAASNPIIAKLLPFGTTNDGVGTQLLPAWAKHFKNAYPEFFGTTDEWKQQADIEMRQEWTDFKNGKGSDPTKNMDQVKDRVRNRFLLRGIIGMGAPVSIAPNNEMQFYLDQAHLYRAQYGDTQNTPQYKALLAQYEQQYGNGMVAQGRLVNDHPEYKDWLTKYREDFPGYFDMAISISTNDSGLVATNAAVSDFKKYRGVIAAHPDYAWMIAGEDNAYGLTPDTQYSGAVHNFELSTSGAPGGTGLRRYEDPVESLKQAEIQKGWASYQVARTKLNIAMEAAGIKSLRETRAAGLADKWNAYIKQAETYNQYWASAYLDRDEGKALDMMNAASDAMGSSPELAKRNDMVAMASYIRSRQIMMTELAKRGGGGIDAEANKDLGILWDGYVQGLRSSSPGFEQMWIKGLESDKLNTEVRK